MSNVNIPVSNVNIPVSNVNIPMSNNENEVIVKPLQQLMYNKKKS
jgi:hypothetical protein